MKNRILVVLVSVILTLTMVLGILAGCGPAAPTTTAPGATTKAPTSTGTAKPTTTVAPTAPAKAGETFNWIFQSGASAGSAGWWISKEFVENIKIASGGRLNIDLFPAGAITSRMEILDAVGAGSIEMGHNNDNDWVGKDVEFNLGDIPGGMTNLVQLCWIWFRNPDDQFEYSKTYGDQTVSPGLQIWQKLHDPFNIKVFMSTGTCEVNYMANKLLFKPSDYVGSTFRSSGWESNCITYFGGKPVNMPSSDVYTALQTGVIDATQAGGASSNIVSGYQDLTKYWGFPGMHNLGQTSSWMINKDAWNKLPADLQKIIELEVAHFYLTNMAFNNVMDARMVPRLSEYGITTVYLSEAQQLNWRNAMLETGKTHAAEDPEFQASWDKTMDFQYTLERYFDLQTPRYGSDYPGSAKTYKGIVTE